MHYLIVGLGNPGKEYEHTRHNVGFIIVDALQIKNDAVPISTKLNARISSARTEQGTILCMEPRTFMNDSGSVVVPFMKTKKITPAHLLVVHDELDLPLGTVRVSKNASSAGHNGVQSIIDTLGSQDFTRVRIGIGPRPTNIPADAFVLQKFSAKDQKHLIDEIIPRSLQAINDHISN